MNEDPTVPLGVDASAAHDAPPAAAAWGSFRLLARVGHGGFGEVYRAWDPSLQREVALKLLLPGAVGTDAEYDSLLREARALAAVRHPNIVQVHGIDRHDGRVGFWTDFVHGKTLSVLIGEQGTFGAREAASIGLDVARALSAVHRSGLLHRDIKAENVMREEGGRIVLMDFGLSSLDQRNADIAGTPNYMAPELFDGGHSSVVTDIYAMGVLLYYMVAGQYPVRLSGLSIADARAAFAHRTPLIDLRPDLHDSLLRAVSIAIELDPARRFTSAGQLAEALAESLGASKSIEATHVTAPLSSTQTTVRWLLAGFLTVAVLGGGSIYLLNHSKKPHDVPQPSGSYEAFQKAQDLLLNSYKESNVEEAIKGFLAVPEGDPNYPLAQARLGAAYLVEYDEKHDPKLLDQAKQTTDRANQLDPELAAPYINRSRIAAMQGQTQIAIEQAHFALEKEKNSADAHGALGDVYDAQGLDDKAIDEYREAEDLAPDDWHWPLSLGVELFQKGDIPGSIEQLERTVAKAPDAAVAYFNLSIAHSRSGQIDKARADLEKMLTIEKSGRAYSALGDVLMLEGRYDEAAQMEKEAIKLSPDRYGEWANLATIYQWSGKNHDEEIKDFTQAVKLEEEERAKQPRNPSLLVTLAENYAYLGNASRGLELATQALALDRDDPEVDYRAGEVYETLGQRDKAIPLMAHALATGYRNYEFDHNPLLASLRSDPRMKAAIDTEKAKKK